MNAESGGDDTLGGFDDAPPRGVYLVRMIRDTKSFGLV